MNFSGRPLDVALQQDGYLAVQLPDGSEAYTRNGNIQISANGQMTVQGYPLMGDNGPIDVPPQAAVTIAADGTISALNAGDSPNTIAQLGQIKRVQATAGEMMHGDDGLFHLTPETQQARGAQLPNDPLVNLANVSTNGFKRQRAVFEDLLYQTLRQPGAQSSEQTTLPSGLQIGTGVRPVATERLHSQGNLSQTNNSKDIAIKGEGFSRYKCRMGPTPIPAMALSRLTRMVN